MNNTFDLTFYAEPFSLLYTLKTGLLTAIFIGEGTLNSVFWCMPIIFIGSYLVYGVLMFFGGLNRRSLVYLALFFISFYSPVYTSFLAGIVAADYLSRRSKSTDNKHEKYASLYVILGLVCGLFPEVLFPMPSLTYIFYGIGALFILYAIGISNVLQKALSARFLVKCGEYSFSMIIAHFPLMYTLPALAFIKVYTDDTYMLALGVSFTVFIVVTAIGTYLFHKLVGDIPTRLSSKVYALLSAYF